jgi:hypothetical protein
VDRLKNTAVERVTQKQKTVQWKVPTENRQTVEDSKGHSKTKQQIVHSEVLTDSGQTVEDSSGHSDTEPTDRVV